MDVQSHLDEAAAIALSHYPDLGLHNVRFVINPMSRKNFMQAQPTWISLLKPKAHRKYVILISQRFSRARGDFGLGNLPKDVLVGWLGHELGHVMDYEGRSNLNMIAYGVRYLFSQDHVTSVEQAADTFAVMHGMGEYLLACKEYIINSSDLDESYKEQIRKYYYAPEDIMELIQEHAPVA